MVTQYLSRTIRLRRTAYFQQSLRVTFDQKIDCGRISNNSVTAYDNGVEIRLAKFQLAIFCYSS